jgi:hypothetical protein
MSITFKATRTTLVTSKGLSICPPCARRHRLRTRLDRPEHPPQPCYFCDESDVTDGKIAGSKQGATSC